MTLFLIFANQGEEAGPIIRDLRQAGHRVLYWVGAPNFEVKNFPEIIFHDFKDAKRAIPPNRINAAKYPPPPASLIRKLYRVEVMFEMINDKNFNHLPFSQRKHLYYEQLRYWLGVLSEFCPEAMVFTGSPAGNYTYLVYELATMLGIKTIMFTDTFVSDRTFVHHDLWDSGRQLREAIARNNGRKFTADDLSLDLKAHYLKQLGRDTGQAKPWYFHMYRKKYSGWRLVWHKTKVTAKIMFTRKIAGVIYKFVKNRLGSNLWKDYHKLQIVPDFSRQFVYLPLQYQPERSTLPHGEIFADLILAVETVAAALPRGWILYVKEHPAQWWRQGRSYTPFRYRGYYEKIARIPNVCLVPVETDSFELVKHSQAVAVVTGMTGWDAILHRKPTLLFGYPWYRDFPLAFKVEDTASCREALTQVQQGYSVSEEAVLNFLKSFDEITIRCYIDDPYDTLKVTVTELSTEQRLRNAASAIIKHLAEMEQP